MSDKSEASTHDASELKEICPEKDDSDDEYLSADSGDSEHEVVCEMDKSDHNNTGLSSHEQLSSDSAVPGAEPNEKVKSDTDEENDNDSENIAPEDDHETERFSDEEESEIDRRKMLEDSLTEEEREERRRKSQELKDSGNTKFRNGDFEDAQKEYTDALSICPLVCQKERAIMFSNRAACKLKQEQHESAIKDCSKALELHPHYLKAVLRRAELYEKTDKLDEALADFQKVVELDPSNGMATAACMTLPKRINDRNEKMKEEMMGKLKDLGNLVLRPFGLSTNNFKMQQDPQTGSYSMQFQQNTPGNGT